MTKERYIEAIESLNKQIIQLKSSKEYRLGKKILEVKEKKKFFSRTITYLKTKKYNHSEPDTNDYKEINHVNLKNKKIVIYTALIGKYDNIKDPLIVSENCDYIIFTDQNIDSDIWKIRKIPTKVLKLKKPTLINRYFKMHPTQFFSEYDYAIYIDSSISIISKLDDLVYRLNPKYGIAFHKHRYRSCIYEEIKVCELLKKGELKKLVSQRECYLENGFPAEYGMLECGMIVCDLHQKVGKEILEDWWDEFISAQSMRDQIALPYILWKRNIRLTEVNTLGNNIYKNEKIMIEMEHLK